MLPSSNGDIPFYPNIPTRYSHIISYEDFNQDSESQLDGYDNKGYPPLASSVLVQQLIRQPPIPSPRLSQSSLAISSSSLLKDTTITFVNEKNGIKSSLVLVEENAKQAKSGPAPPTEAFKTLAPSERTQPIDPLEMSLIDDDDDDEDHQNNHTIALQEEKTNNNHFQRQQNISEPTLSQNSSVKRSSSDEHASILPNDDDEESLPHEIKSITTTVAGTRTKPMPKINQINKIPSSSTASFNMKNGKSSSLKWNRSLNTPRSLAVVPSITNRAVQGVLVRFFRNADEHHHGVKTAINAFELKSWEAFLNYLNRQPKLVLSTGGIKHVYSLNGQEIRAIDQLQHRQSYVVSSGSFTRTHYRHLDDTFADETEMNISTSIQQDIVPYWNTRFSVYPRWRSPPLSLANGEQIFLLPYSKLNMYESLILNRNATQTFDEWLQDQVTDVLSRYTNDEGVTHLFAITNTTFIEIKSFSKLFSMMKMTDTFVGCTDDEYGHAKHYLATMKPREIFTDRVWTRRALIRNHPRRPLKRVETEDAKLTLSWIHGYNGENELTKTLYSLPENEILYVIGSICILYEPQIKQQRFYIKHNHPITCVTIHQSQSLVASSEIGSSKVKQSASIHIWEHVKLRTITELRKEPFGSYISLLSFSPKPDDNLLLIISRDKPKVVLFVDWKRNELIYSITCKSENILSLLFVFDTTEWIACISQQHLLFYHVNWGLRPLRMLERRESEVQNIYTGAAACDTGGERLLVGDKVGSIHVWQLIENEPKLMTVQESVLENDIELIVPISQEAFLLANGQNQMKIWNVKLNTIEQIRLSETIGSIQSICCIRRNSHSNALAIGTKSNYIISKEIGKEQCDVIMRGHTSPAVCIRCNRYSHSFYSISSDRFLFKWNDRTKSVEWSAKSPQPISCADLHPERNIIVLGTETSKLLIYDSLSSFYIVTITLKVNTGVKAVRFSPDGADLAVGLQNGNVCLFDVLGNGDFHLRTDGILQNDSAPVSDVIWSVDSKYLLAVYTDNDYNIWSVPSFEIVRGRSIQNIQWHQVVHPVMCNILDKSVIDTHTSAIILSPDLVLCCGKDGHLRLFRNRYERNSQTFQLGLGPVQSITPSTMNNNYLLAMSDNPVIVEVQVNVNSRLA